MINLHILDAAGSLAPCRRKLKRGFRTARSRVRRLLPIADVDIVMQVLPSLRIPETGVGGYSPSSNLAFIYLDPDNPRFKTGLDVEIAPTIAHELFHCIRWLGPGYGVTLGEALVSEGLALHFETLIRGQPPFYATALTSIQLDKLLDYAKPNLELVNYDHLAWFSGSSERGIPRFGGYSLGFSLVARRLSLLSARVQDAWNQPAADFLNQV